MRITLINTSVCHAQTKPLHFTHYTTEHGLSQASIYSIFQDKKGFLWFGSWDGLNRFDGYTFTVFRPTIHQQGSLQGSRVNSIIEDSSALIWVGTYEALNSFNYATNSFEAFYVKDENGKAIKDRYYPFFIDDKNELWFTYAMHHLASMNLRTKKITTYPFVKGNMQHFVSANYPKQQFYRPLKKVYTTGSNGLRVVDIASQQVTIYFSDNPQNSIGKRNFIWNLVSEGDSILWLAGQNGLIEFHINSNRFIEYHQRMNQFEALALTNVLEVNRNEFWCGTDGNGLWIFDRRTKKYSAHYYTDPTDMYSIGANTITYLFKDKDANIWVSSDPQSIDKASPQFQQFHHYRLQQKANKVNSNSVWSICELDSNRVIVCFNQQGPIIYNYKTNQEKHFAIPSGFKESSVYHALRDTSGNIWLSTDIGIFHSKNQLQSIQKIYPFNSYYTTLVQDGNKLVIGNKEGLFFLPVDLHTHKLDTIIPLNNKSISAIAKGKDLFAATESNEFFILQEYQQRYKVKHQFTFEALIKSILPEGDSVVWLGTNVGLIRFHYIRKTYVVYNEKNGMANSFVYGILPGKKNELWLSTNKGIISFDKQTKQITNHGLAEGVQGWEFNSRSFCKTKDGMLFFGGVNGLNYFHPDQLSNANFETTVQLTDWKVNNQSKTLAELWKENNHLVLSPQENNFTISFVAIDVNRSQQLQYAYKLKEDEEWTPIGNQRTLHFIDMQPGEYNLQVKVQYGNNTNSFHPLQIPFTIQTPFLKSIWFLLLCMICIGGLLYSLYRYRVAQLKNIMAIRTGISRDLHDDMGSTLSSISMYADIAKRRIVKMENVEDILTKIQLASVELIHKMSDIVWSLQANNENVLQLSNRMQNLAAFILTPQSIFFELEVDEKMQSIKLSPLVLKNVYLIYKEAMTNAAKYSGAKKVTLSFRKIEKRLCIEMCDDGIGFSAQQTKPTLGGAGLFNMHERATTIHANLHIESAPYNGTKVITILS